MSSGPGAPAPHSVPTAPQVAPGQVDYRYPFSLEPGGTVAFFAEFSGYGTSQVTYGGQLTFAGPVAEKRQVIGGVEGAAGSSSSGHIWYAMAYGGYRILTFADPWRTRFDFDLAANYAQFNIEGIKGVSSATRSGFGLGARLSVAVQYYPTHSFGIGPEAELGVFGITFEVVASLGVSMTFNW